MPLLRSYVCSSLVRRHYTTAQVLLPLQQNNQIEAKCFEGIIELPSLGYLRVPDLTRSRTCVVTLDPIPRVVFPEVISVHVPPALIFKRIEVIERMPAAYRTLFWNKNPQTRVSQTKHDRMLLSRAGSLLEGLSIFDLLMDVTDSILLFHNSTKNSFYDTRAHGTVFIRLTKACDAFHLVEEFVHQAGHALFSILMSEPNRFSHIPEYMPIRSRSTGELIARPFGVALHGLVTEALVAETFFEIYSTLPLTAFEQHQALGRLAFATRKLVADLHLLAKYTDRFTREGVILSRAIGFTCSRILHKLGASLEQVNLTKQNYIFSPKRFLSANQFGPEAI